MCCADVVFLLNWILESGQATDWAYPWNEDIYNQDSAQGCLKDDDDDDLTDWCAEVHFCSDQIGIISY